MIQNTLESVAISAPHNNVVGDEGPANSLPAALRGCNSQLAAFAPTTSEKREAQLTLLPSAVLQTIGKLLSPHDAANLAGTCKSLSKVEGLLEHHKDRFLSQPLTSFPRESRVKTLQTFLAHADTHPGVIDKAIAAYGHIPSQQRPQARQAIIKRVEQQPQPLTEKLAYVGARLNEIAGNLESVDAFHDGNTETAKMSIAQIVTLEPENQAEKFLEKCDDIITLPEEHQLDAFLAILGKTQNREVLRMLANLIRELPEADRSTAWRALLNHTTDSKVLVKLAEAIGHLPQANKSTALRAILKKTTDPEVLLEMAKLIRELPEADKITAWRAILNRTTDSRDPLSLAWKIRDLPNEDRRAAWYDILNATEVPQTLQHLSWQIGHLPMSDQITGMSALEDKTSHPHVLRKLP